MAASCADAAEPPEALQLLQGVGRGSLLPRALPLPLLPLMLLPLPLPPLPLMLLPLPLLPLVLLPVPLPLPLQLPPPPPPLCAASPGASGVPTTASRTGGICFSAGACISGFSSTASESVGASASESTECHDGADGPLACCRARLVSGH